MRVYKYVLWSPVDEGPPMPDARDWVEVRMPVEAKVISAGMQGWSLVVWALVDPEYPIRTEDTRIFRVAGTGHYLDDTSGEGRDVGRRFEFIDTVQDSLGLVWHVFELVDADA